MAGIYIHIPFCKQACNYCNFHFATSLLKKDALIAAIVKEIRLVHNGHQENIETVYLGGGTPSILSAQDLQDIFTALRACFKIDDNAEITLEANPDDIDAAALMLWKSLGINRLSIGVQSFFEEDLQWMHRAHNAVQAKESIRLATQQFDNITIDLIYGVPGLTDEKWHSNVQTAIDFGIAHLSCYALTVEPQTPLNKLIRTNKKAAVSSEQQSAQFLLLMDWLQAAGYEHYEISNFAKPGMRSRHNSSYWKGVPYIGIGPSAHSYDGKNRMWNVANNQQYIDAINKNVIPQEVEELTAIQQLNETIMIALRTAEGLSLLNFSEAQQKELLRHAKKYIAQDLLLWQDERLQLTRQGKLFADGIAADLFF